MNAECLPPDRITNLPLSIIQTILTLMPIRDAFRTSILSRNWRYHCINIPKLEFDDKLLEGSADSQLYDKCKIFLVVYNVLLTHHDPVLEFSLCFSKLESSYETDRIILHLSRNTALEKFSLYMGGGSRYKLPSSFFSLQKLTHLKLKQCVIQPISSSFGFSMLKSLRFDRVTISMSTLTRFLRCCPLLKSFTLLNFFGNGYSNFVELLRCLPLIEHLPMDYDFGQLFPLAVERRLPNMLDHLRVLQLSELSFAQEDELSSLLLLVTSFPNIEKINLKIYYEPNEAISEIAVNLLDLHDYSNLILNNLRELEITNFSSKKPEMDFVKLILSKSPMLKTVRIVIDGRISDSDEVQILRSLLWIARASTGAQIKFERP